jgi:hypothetical protein
VRTLSLVAGLVCLAEVLLDAFQTIILPRRASGRLRVSRLFLTGLWYPTRALAGKLKRSRTRESFLSYFGPLSLLSLVFVWALGLILGFGLIYHGLGSPFADPKSFGLWRTDLYVSGTTLFTLGLGDVVPLSLSARLLVTLEAGIGLAFVAGVIAYLPVLYGAFSRREVSIILLDARAGSPPSAVELLRRHAGSTGESALQTLLVEWERWSAELLESHISYPQLCFFRSQHDNQSWLSALVTMLDACSLLIATVEGEAARQAQLTFIMARHAVLDLAHVLSQDKPEPGPDRFPQENLDAVCRQLAEAGFTLCAGPATLDRVRELRAMYEPEVWQVSRILMQPLPLFYPEANKRSAWGTITRLRSQAEASLHSIPGPEQAPAAIIPVSEETHSF